jgi:hypothetical protein
LFGETHALVRSLNPRPFLDHSISLFRRKNITFQMQLPPRRMTQISRVHQHGSYFPNARATGAA